MKFFKIKAVGFLFVAATISINLTGCGEEAVEPPPVIKPVKTITVTGYGEGEITFSGNYRGRGKSINVI